DRGLRLRLDERGRGAFGVERRLLSRRPSHGNRREHSRLNQKITTSQTGHRGLHGRLWSSGALLRQSLVIVFDQPFILRKESLADRPLHLITTFVGQVPPQPAQDVLDIGGFGLLLGAALDALTAAARREGGRLAGSRPRLVGAATTILPLVAAAAGL